MIVFACGHACLDSIALLTHAPGPDEKVEATRLWAGPGGPAANASVALRRLGHEVRLWCATGDDPQGEWLRRSLGDEGIELIEGRPRGSSTSLAQIRSLQGQRSVAWRRGQLDPLSCSPEQAEGWLADADLLYLDAHEVAAATVLVEAARRRVIPILVDLGSLRPGVENWLQALPWIAVAPRFARTLSNSSEIAAQLRALEEAAAPGVPVAVTAGENGCWLRHDGRSKRIPARRVDVVDSTGAGDAFHAGLADAIAQGLDPERAVRWASALAASVCREVGGQLGLPRDRAEADRWAATLPDRD